MDVPPDPATSRDPWTEPRKRLHFPSFKQWLLTQPMPSAFALAAGHVTAYELALREEAALRSSFEGDSLLSAWPEEKREALVAYSNLVSRAQYIIEHAIQHR